MAKRELETDVSQWDEDTTTISSAEKAEEETYAELLEAVNVVKPKISLIEWSVEEFTEDGEYLGWDIWIEEG